MTIEETRRNAKKQVLDLLANGHTAVLEDICDQNDVLIDVVIHHYPMCRQCVKEREAHGKERKV